MDGLTPRISRALFARRLDELVMRFLEIGMIRARFKANPDDYRPVNWPVKHPFWCTGYGPDCSIVVAYADDEAEILRNWPEATDIDADEADEYLFTSRFPKPDWFDA